MLYYAIRFGLATDGTKIQSLTSFDNLDEARQKYHNDLFGYIGHCRRICCMLVDSVGNVINREEWESAAD